MATIYVHLYTFDNTLLRYCVFLFQVPSIMSRGLCSATSVSITGSPQKDLHVDLDLVEPIDVHALEASIDSLTWWGICE